MSLKVSSAKWRPFCLDLNVLKRNRLTFKTTMKSVFYREVPITEMEMLSFWQNFDNFRWSKWWKWSKCRHFRFSDPNLLLPISLFVGSVSFINVRGAWISTPRTSAILRRICCRRWVSENKGWWSRNPHYSDTIKGTIVSNHRRLECSRNHLFRRRSKKTPKLCVTCLCEGNSPVTDESPTQRTSNAENVSIWWRHHAME